MYGDKANEFEVPKFQASENNYDIMPLKNPTSPGHHDGEDTVRKPEHWKTGSYHHKPDYDNFPILVHREKNPDAEKRQRLLDYDQQFCEIFQQNLVFST